MYTLEVKFLTAYFSLWSILIELHLIVVYYAVAIFKNKID
jgi:hypothetical protein